MKKSTFLILLLFTSTLCFSQRNDPYFTTSRIIKSTCDSSGNDTLGYFKGRVLLDSTSKLLKNHIGSFSILYLNEATHHDTIYEIKDDSGRFKIGLKQGYYDLIISKQGYQTILIKGFHSYRNEELAIKAILEPGSTKNIYTLSSDCIMQKYVSAKSSYVAKFYYGDLGDTTVAMLWGQLFLNTFSPAGDSSVGFGKVLIKYRCIERPDSGLAQSDDASKFAIYFKEGHYNITISYPGYQTIVLKNYYAYEAQESYLDAVLEPGDNKSIFGITKNGEIDKEQ